jgi:tRNA(Phe) wybutosine-synthesizing methylase Tyw3
MLEIKGDIMRKFYKAVIQVEILSKDLLSDHFLSDLSVVNDAITEGDCSGVVKVIEQKTLTSKQVAKALIKQGSSPSLFRLNEVGEEEEVH